MSSARRKGNALETKWARDLHAVDGHDPALVPYETPTGRLGNTYRLQIDVASEHVASECKNREDNPRRLWEWLNQIEDQAAKLDKLGVVVIGRNRHRPLVLQDAEVWLALLDGRMPWQA